jgi:hypothetical protein
VDGGDALHDLRTGLDDLHAIAARPMDPVVRNLAKAPEDEPPWRDIDRELKKARSAKPH